MKTGTFEFIVQTLKDYNDTEKHINKRIQELRYPFSPTDENIGGGRSSIISKPTERLAIRIADDLLLSSLRHNKYIVDRVLDGLEPKARELIELYYINQPRKYTWTGVAEKVGYSEKQCRNIRDAVFEEIAKKLGMPI